VANLSVLIAEKILDKELGNAADQKTLIQDMLNKTNIN